MKNILILFSILLFGGLILTANAQSTNHVVINEVDTNPFGDDSKSISEWVELYNPTSSKIDISGWKIASTSGMKKTLSIPAGTFIEPGKFLTFTFESLWFTDNNEVVELKDKNGISIDKTPIISDLKSDFTSWQRIYDGYDSDSISDWKFVTSTAGSTNGKLTAVKDTDALSITVSSTKSSYLFGETAIIQGKVSKQVFIEKPYFHSDEIIVKITGPSYDKTISLYPDLNLNYKTSLSLQQVLGINKGTYSVLVSYGGATSQTSFSVSDKLIVEEIPEESTLSITTNKSQYLPGDSLILTGITSKVIPFEGLKFTIKDPNGNTISTGSLYPTNGKFSTNIFLSTVNPTYGKYSITAEYFDKGALAFFEVVKDIKEEKAISIWTDKDAYNLGETVTVTGRLNQLWVAFVDLGILQTKNISENNIGDTIKPLKISDILKISGDGSFAYSFKIPDNSAGLGDYTITISKDIGTSSKVIHVVSNSTGYVASSAPISLSTDKVIYDLGDSMTIDGFIVNPVSSSTLQKPSVKISIYHENGTPLEIIGQIPGTKTRTDNGIIVAYEFTAIPESSGRFSVQTKITPNAFAEGSYKIKAEYRGLSTSTLIGIVDPLKASKDGAVLSLNKQVYGLGESVLLTGLLPPTGASTVQISLTAPDGSMVVSGATVNNQRFSWSWTTPITEKPLSIKLDDRSVSKTNYGIYKIRVSTDSANKDTFFKVSPNPESDSLSLSPITVSAEKSLYKAGEKLKVIGNVIAKEQTSQGLIPQRISVMVLDGKFPYKQIFESTVYPQSGGNFESIFELPITVFKEGEYKIKAMYSGKTAETTFSVANDFALNSDAKLSLLLATDKSEYYPGDTVNISGKPSKLIYIEKFDVSVIQKKDGSATCGTFFCGKHLGPVTTIRPSSSGSFSHQFQIPESISGIGSYEITVDAGFATKSYMFNVVEKPIIVESTSSPTVIEKINRILDSQIQVLTSEKTVDGSVVLPRVFSGSLITAKSEQSTVNIRVTSESGVCVIGPEENCLVKDSTRKPGQIYEVVSVNGIDLKVRYSGPDVYLEKFDILPESTDGFLPDTNWIVDIIKEEQASRFYYKINYSVLG